MINFFRKTRKKLADDNKPLKYARYAIGEIVLVMIGILLALQVNNWNTNKQETNELQNYLRNILNNLRADLIAIEEIKVFRDSSRVHSNNYLRISGKDEITIDDFNTIQNSHYKVYYDKYFKPRKSGFETLKNSGFIGKLNGTEIEAKLNEYYYLIDKITEREESLNNTVENLENVAMTQNIQLRMFEIQNKTKTKDGYFSTNQREIKELLNNPSLKSANFRNRGHGPLHRYYNQSEQLAQDLISEIDVFNEKY